MSKAGNVAAEALNDLFEDGAADGGAVKLRGAGSDGGSEANSDKDLLVSKGRVDRGGIGGIHSAGKDGEVPTDVGRKRRRDGDVVAGGGDGQGVVGSHTFRRSSGSRPLRADVESDDVEEFDETREALMRLRHSSLEGSRSVEAFERENYIDEGTYGVVSRAREKKTGRIVALKQIKMEKEKDGFPLTALREVTTLLNLQHKNIVQMNEVVVGSSLDKIFMVMEYMEHDLKVLMGSLRDPFTQSEVKCLMIQLLEATNYMHMNWIVHRDLKTSNLLLNNKGVLKVCDFGLARKYGSPLRKTYTTPVCTLWYRPPELLLGERKYSTAVDVWSAGCIFAEFLTRKPLVPGTNELDQIDKIFELLGTPNDDVWPGFSKTPDGSKVVWKKHKPGKLRAMFPKSQVGGGSSYLSDLGFDLLQQMLCYDPEQRISAADALKHPYFSESPRAKEPSQMPTFPETHNKANRKKFRAK